MRSSWLLRHHVQYLLVVHAVSSCNFLTSSSSLSQTGTRHHYSYQYSISRPARKSINETQILLGAPVDFSPLKDGSFCHDISIFIEIGKQKNFSWYFSLFGEHRQPSLRSPWISSVLPNRFGSPTASFQNPSRPTQ